MVVKAGFLCRKKLAGFSPFTTPGLSPDKTRATTILSGNKPGKPEEKKLPSFF
jgi:hypothetical protein